MHKHAPSKVAFISEIKYFSQMGARIKMTVFHKEAAKLLENTAIFGLPAISIVSSCDDYVKDVDVSVAVNIAAGGVFRFSEL